MSYVHTSWQEERKKWQERPCRNVRKCEACSNLWDIRAAVLLATGTGFTYRRQNEMWAEAHPKLVKKK